MITGTERFLYTISDWNCESSDWKRQRRWNATECVTANDKGKVYKKWSFIISRKKYRTLTRLWYSRLKSNTRKCMYVYMQFSTMQNWTVELTGTNHEDVQNTNEQMQRRKVPSWLLNTMVKIQFSVPEPMLAAKHSMDMLRYKAEVKSVHILFVPLLEVGKRTWALLLLGSDHFYWK